MKIKAEDAYEQWKRAWMGLPPLSKIEQNDKNDIVQSVEIIENATHEQNTEEFTLEAVKARKAKKRGTKNVSEAI